MPSQALYLPDGRNAVRVAVEQAQGVVEMVWVVADDGTVWRLAGGGEFEPVAWYPLAGDVGASPQGRAWVVGRKQAPDATFDASQKLPADGKQLWRWTDDAWGWRRVKPAWGQAVDIDGDDGPWVVDGTGRVFARGIQVLAAYPNLREKGALPAGCPPNPDPKTEFTYRAFENFQRQAAAGAAGVVLLERWDALLAEAAADPNGQTSLTGKIDEWGKKRGFRIFLNVSPTFFGASAVPGYLNPDFATLAEPFTHFVQQKVFTIPGFHEHVAYLSVGNEVDLYLGDSPAAWDKYMAAPRLLLRARLRSNQPEFPAQGSGQRPRRGRWPGSPDRRLQEAGVLPVFLRPS